MLREAQHPHEKLRAQAADYSEQNRVEEESRFVSTLHLNLVPLC